MLDVKVKGPDEIYLEKQMRNPLGLSKIQDSKHKYQFFRDKVKEFINYHLDFGKYDKKIISEDELNDIRKIEEEKPKILKKKLKTIEEKDSDIKNLRQNLLNQVNNLEKISSLIKSAQRSIENLENTETKDQSLKFSFFPQIFATILDLINKDIINFHHILTQLDNYHNQSFLTLQNQKKDFAKTLKSEIQNTIEKNEQKLKALYQHNKSLSSAKHESKLSQVFKEKIESLESQMNEISESLSKKTDQLKQKTAEIQVFKQNIEKLNEEVLKLQNDKKSLESLITVQQESYHGQIYDLTSEIARIKNISQESQLAHQLEISELKYLSESSKNRLDQVVFELEKCEEQLDYEKKQAQDREDFLSTENRDLRIEIERLDRIVISLKEDLDRCIPGLEIENLKNSRNDEERLQLNHIISKLESESSELLRYNKEMFVKNQKLENQLEKLKESRSKSAKSEKKTKKK